MRDPKITMDTVRTALVLLGPAGNSQMMMAAVNGAARLERISRGLQRISELECNGIPQWGGGARWEDKDQADADKRRARLMTQANEIAASWGFDLRNQRDPRGAALYIVRADGSEWAV